MSTPNTQTPIDVVTLSMEVMTVARRATGVSVDELRAMAAAIVDMKAIIDRANAFLAAHEEHEFATVKTPGVIGAAQSTAADLKLALDEFKQEFGYQPAEEERKAS